MRIIVKILITAFILLGLNGCISASVIGAGAFGYWLASPEDSAVENKNVY